MILDPKKEEDLEEIKAAIREDYTDDDIGVQRSVMSAIDHD